MNIFKSIMGVLAFGAVLASMQTMGVPPNRTIVDHLRQRNTYLRATEVMALLDVTRATLCSWINTGQLKAYRLGKNNSVDPADLVSFLEARCTRG